MNLEPKFKIGDTVFQARGEQTRIWITCPECCGDGWLRVILGDDSQVSIACVCCERGYEGSPGRISTYVFSADVHATQVVGTESELRNGVLHTCYKFNGGYTTDELDVFATREYAQIRSNDIVREHSEEETKRLGYKKNQAKTWAWNVSYYRKMIRDAQKSIDRATAHLNVAPKKGQVLETETPQ